MIFLIKDIMKLGSIINGGIEKSVLLWGGVAILAIATYAMIESRYPSLPSIPGLGFDEDDPKMAAPPADSNAGWFYGRPYGDRGLSWVSAGFGNNDPSRRVTTA